MSIKTIQVAKADVGPWSTLVGSSGEISIEGAELNNTIFGSEFQSSISGVRDWSFSGNSWFREKAGFEARIKRASAPVAVTGEAMSLYVGSDLPANTYVVDTASRNLWDIDSSIVIYEDGVAVPEDEIVSIDPMFGRVTFTTARTDAITADFSYMTTAAFGCANSVSLTLNSESTGNSCFETVQAENGFNVYEYGLKTVSAELSGFYRETNDFFAILKSGEKVIIEFDFEGTGDTSARGVFRLTSTSQSGDVGAQEEYSASFGLYVPEDLTPFSFNFGVNSSASDSVKLVIGSWINREYVYLRYLPKGITSKGYVGKTVVTDCSISVSVDSIGEVSVELTGTGELEVIN